MIKRIAKVADAMALGGTLEEASVSSFQSLIDASFSGSPVEARWNDMASEYVGGKVVQKRKLVKCHYYCLRSFNSNHTNPTDGFLMKITNKGKRTVPVKAFYDYLFSEDSPWKTAFPGLALVGEDKKGIPDAILWYDVGASPSKHVANLFSAMRLHTCWGLDWVWDRLVTAGFSPEAAILLCTNFSWAGQTITVSNGDAAKFSVDPRKGSSLSKLGCSKTDMPFSTNYNPSGFSLLMKKTPGGDLGSLKDGTPVQPNNYIWHTDGKAVNADSLNKASPEYEKAVIRVSSEVTPIHAYLLSDTKMSSDYIADIEGKLLSNKLVIV